ncbi:MAG: ExeM/NucH family extracellular endonuclease [Pseudomonadota bacterium]|nr:ExeM/NucH family extracellular endonuclease [Pseudomonadota bacterium]
MTIKKSLLAAAISGLLTSSAQASLVISEYIEGSGNNKAIELLNTGADPVDLTAWELQIFYNGSLSPGQTFNLEGNVAPGSNFVFVSSSADPAILAVADQTTSAGLFNGDDAVVLLNGGTAADSIGQVGTDPGSYWGSGDIRTQDRTLRRKDAISGDTDPFDGYDPGPVFDGFPQDTFDDLGKAGGNNDSDPKPPTPDMTCGAPATLISGIQGNGDASPMVGQAVVLEAVVSATFNGDGQLDGFYIEEEAGDRDSDTNTSEGLFIYGPSLPAEPGQVLRIAGEVSEFFGLTQLSNVSASEVCGAASLPAPAAANLPWVGPEAPEALEAMRVSFNDNLTVNDNYDLGRFGSLTLGSQRHFIPTSIANPGADAQAVELMNAMDRVILDDASNRQNPATVPYPSPQLSASQTVRAGDTVENLEGVLDYRFSEWRIQPIATPIFAQDNPRTLEPRLENRGNLVVASLNVLNFFNGDGLGGGFPTDRGADTLEELDRQTNKLVSAIKGLNADIIGLMEIENDGYGENSAIAELTEALGSNWKFVDPDLETLGSDAIAVGFIYRTDRVEIVGQAATLSGSPFADLNRQPLAQTFRPLDSNDAVTIAVNHFKSKGCGNADGANADQGDGQGCWNPARTQASNALASWLVSDPTGTGEEDSLIIGDLNSYAKEDPIQALTGSGYTDLVAKFDGARAYSFVFFGQAGYLDHGLANGSLAAKVADTTTWPINADEPRALDYNTEFKTPEQQASLYAPDAYRSSDHDPVIIALDLAQSSAADPADLNGDGRVNGRDLARFVLALLSGKAIGPDYDINSDGHINRGDMFAMIDVMRNR